MLTEVDEHEARAIAGAMLAVATLDGKRPPSEADTVTIGAAWHYLFRRPDELAVDTLAPLGPDDLAAALSSDAVAEHAARCLAITSLVDGVLDDDEIALVLRYSSALGLHDTYLRDLAETAKGHLQAALADMTRENLLSITGREWNIDDASEWLLPYRGAPDPALHERYVALERYPAGTLGRAFWDWYHGHGFVLPGQGDALNESFATPHDSTHILSGYSTTPQGELLVSTFTAGMHPEEPMAGHILPVIYSWHLGIEINKVAGSFRGALDPEKFWVAWERGGELTTDTFAPDWNFWRACERPVADLRAEYHVPPLDDRFAASSDGTEGVDYHPIA
ncbi:MAG TPA: hypothetical protein VIB48_07315 [Acidimicrobiia bacterium]